MDVGYDNEHFKGYYGYASYFLTGESRTYHVRNGASNRIRPQAEISMERFWLGRMGSCFGL